MTVYVDSANIPYRNMIMCHMVADTTEELLQMAEKIGVQTKWIQKKGTRHEHFDISKGKKLIAIKNGAIEINRKQMGHFLKYGNINA
jgi:FMN phosphatase YigB (HAD superfamily)